MFAAMNGEKPSSILGSILKSSRKGAQSVSRLSVVDGCHVRIPLERVNELAPEERMGGFYDLHGVSTIPSESSETLQSLLQELDEAILGLTDESKDDYERAKALDLDYVQGLRIRFLRAASFNPVEAARNMLHHFKVRQQYFGEKCLVGNLTFASFKSEDLPFFSSGFAQLLSERDRSGRAIIAVYGRQYCVTPIETIVRIQLVYGDIATRDEEVQKNGVVYIYFGYKQTENALFNTKAALNTTRGNPMRIVATHVCYDNPLLHSIVNMTVQEFPSQALIRFKCHFGSVPECLCSLRAFGLPVEALPINVDGTWKRSFAERLLMTLTPDENLSSYTTHKILELHPCINKILQPRDMDIVMGRGKKGAKSLGYLRLKVLHEQYRARYEDGSRQTKVLITTTIYDALVHSGSRFLTQAPDRRSWVLVSELEAKKSIAHGFRNMRRIDRARVERDGCS